MSNHLKGLLIAFFGVLVLTPEGILVKLANSDSFTILFWRGIFFALSILIILFIFDIIIHRNLVKVRH